MTEATHLWDRAGKARHAHNRDSGEICMLTAYSVQALNHQRIYRQTKVRGRGCGLPTEYGASFAGEFLLLANLIYVLRTFTHMEIRVITRLGITNVSQRTRAENFLVFPQESLQFFPQQADGTIRRSHGDKTKTRLRPEEPTWRGEEENLGEKKAENC